jgi:hypothetical protein
MKPQDRALVGRLRSVHANVAATVTGLLGVDLADECPPSKPLRSLADHLDSIAVDLRARADQLDGIEDAIEVPEIGSP